MRYFVMESQESILLPLVVNREGAEVVAASDLSRYCDIDYDVRSGLISERLKLLMAMYMPKYDFDPVVYLDAAQEEQMIFWRFSPPFYADYEADYRNDGVVSRIVFQSDRMPVAFTARSPRGVRSVVVRMAVAESALRREIFGAKFTKITE